MNLRSVSIALAVFATFLVIFVPLALYLQGGRNESIDAGRLRLTYVALALYETEHDNLPAPNLSLIRRDVDPFNLVSITDPHASEGSDFPIDGAKPESKLRSPTRVSWSYRWHWTNAGDPGKVRLDPRAGLLSSWWTGSIDTTNPDGRLCSGPVLRVNVDGSMQRSSRKDTTQLTFPDLFGGS